MRVAILALLIAGQPLFAQPKADPAARFEITGKVLDADSGQPIPRARVTVQRVETTQQEPIPGGRGNIMREVRTEQMQVVVLTDQAGSFRVTNAVAGPYMITSERAGYLGSNPRLDRSSIARVSLDRTAPSPITLYLRRQAVIEGSVLDEFGFAAPGMISLYSFRIQNGRPVLGQAQAPQVQVDPSGSFRIPGFSPGRYYLAYAPFRHREGQTKTLPLVLYPGVPDMSSARPLELLPGREEQVHLRVKFEPAFEIHGTFPAMPKSMQWSLTPLRSRGVPVREMFGIRVEETGAFQFYQVPAGEYFLVAKSPTGLLATRTITVANQNVNDVTLDAGSSSPLRFRVTFDAAPEPKAPSAVLATSTPHIGFTLDSGSTSVNSQPDPQGNHVLAGLLPGAYRLRFSLDNARYVRSARQGGRDVLQDGVMISGNPEPIEVQVGYGKARIEGTIEAPPSTEPPATVALLRRMGADLVLQTYVGPNPNNAKRFVIEALPPGEYLAFAWDNTGNNVTGLPYNTEEFHRRYGSYLERFTIRDSEPVNLTLRGLLPAAAMEAY